MDVLGSFMWHIPSYDDLRRMTWFSMSNYFNFALFLVMVALAILQARAKVVRLFYIEICSPLLSADRSPEPMRYIDLLPFAKDTPFVVWYITRIRLFSDVS